MQPPVRTIAALLTATLAVGLSSPRSQAPSRRRDVGYRRWNSPAGFDTGTAQGTAVAGGDLVFGHPTGLTAYVDPFGDGTARTYEQASWISPEVHAGFGLTELVASWNATTPTGTWIEVALSGRSDTGELTKWYVLARWNSGDDIAAGAIHRTSVPGQQDAVGDVAADTFVANDGRSLQTWRLKVTLYRLAGSQAVPVVRSIGAMASRLPGGEAVAASPAGGAWGRVLAVPTYSQEKHVGHYPQWDNGGEAWCSPTSLAMVLDYWNAGPTPRETAWVDPSDADPQVDHAARSVFDYAYGGAGNWPFNTAYAGSRNLDAFVTRLRSLTEAEQFITAGIPLVVSMSFTKDELPGAGYGTKGHLMMIVGFTATGDVIVNDPASHRIKSNEEVRATYGREAFENAWLPRSGGLVYVIHPSAKRLPPAPAQANW